MDHIPFSDLRAKLAETLSNLDERTEPLFIARRGRRTAVLLSVSQYEALVNKKYVDDGPAARLEAWRAEYASELQALNDEAGGEPFADVRDKSPDRPVTWTDDIGA
jgi:prevent-host-death family protein